MVYNASIIFGALFLAAPFGVRGLAWGVVAGSVGHLLVQLPALRAVGMRWQPAVDVASEVGHIPANSAEGALEHEDAVSDGGVGAPTISVARARPPSAVLLRGHQLIGEVVVPALGFLAISIGGGVP